jgi:hypothetical protein
LVFASSLLTWPGGQHHEKDWPNDVTFPGSPFHSGPIVAFPKRLNWTICSVLCGDFTLHIADIAFSVWEFDLRYQGILESSLMFVCNMVYFVKSLISENCPVLVLVILTTVVHCGVMEKCSQVNFCWFLWMDLVFISWSYFLLHQSRTTILWIMLVLSSLLGRAHAYLSVMTQHCKHCSLWLSQTKIQLKTWKCLAVLVNQSLSCFLSIQSEWNVWWIKKLPNGIFYWNKSGWNNHNGRTKDFVWWVHECPEVVSFPLFCWKCIVVLCCCIWHRLVTSPIRTYIRRCYHREPGGASTLNSHVSVLFGFGLDPAMNRWVLILKIEDFLKVWFQIFELAEWQNLNTDCNRVTQRPFC